MPEPGPRELVVGALLALDQIRRGGGDPHRIGAVLGQLDADVVDTLVRSVAHDGAANLGYGFTADDLDAVKWLCDAVTSTDVDPGLAEVLDVPAFDRLCALVEVLDGGPRPWVDGAGDAAYRDDLRRRERRLEVTVARPARNGHLLLGLSPVPTATATTNGEGGPAPDTNAPVQRSSPGRGHGPQQGWQPLTATSRSALSAAAEAVGLLLEELEFATRPAPTRYGVPGCLPPTTIEDATLALPAALWLLGELVGMPRRRVVAAGAWEGGQFVPMDEDEAASRLAALRVDGRHDALLVPAGGGWRLLRVDGGGESLPDDRRDVDGAARVLWGDDWENWAGRCRRALLERRDCYLRDWSRPVREPVPEAPMGQVDEILSVLRNRPVATVVLGGPASSGKTVIAGQVARRLAAPDAPAPRWTVAMMSVNATWLPETDELVALGRHALALAEAGAGPRLLILDDLLPVGEGDVDRILPEVAEQLDASVLAVLRYEPHSLRDWETDTVAVVTAPGGVEASRLFALTLVAQTPELAGVDSATVRSLAERYPNDARALTAALADAAGGRSVQQAEAEFRNLFGRLGDGGRDQVAGMAARSLLRSETHERHLQGLTPQELIALGAERGYRRGHWRFSSYQRCRQVLREYGRDDQPGAHPDQSIDPVLIELGGRELVNALRVADPSQRDVLSLLRGARLGSEAVCDGIIAAAKRVDGFATWMSNVDVAERAALLRLVDGALGDDLLPRLLKQFADTLPDSSRAMTPAGLADVLYVLARRRDLIEDAAFDRCAEWVAEAFAAQLDRAIGPRNRTDLFRIEYRMVRLHHDVTNTVLRERGSEILRGLSRNRVLDYITVRRVDKLIRQATGDGVWAAPVDNEPDVQDLLDSVPPANRGVALQLAWLTLRMHFGREDTDWRAVIRTHEERIRKSMRSSKARELRLALGELYDYNPQFCTMLLNEFRHFDSAVRNLLLVDALPTEAADLLNTVLRIHGMTAFRVITTDRDSTAHKTLAQHLASRVTQARDGKGAGMLLSVTQAIDDQYRFTGASFAHLLAGFLGRQWVLDQVANDPRTSTKYYLIKGVWQAGIDYREEIMEAAVEAVANEINKSLRSWGPQLAVMLGEDRELGEVAMRELSARVSHQRLLHAMRNAPTPDAQVHFHRLGRALYPGIAGEYLRHFDPGNLHSRLLSFSPDATVQWCLATAQTLTLAGLSDAGHQVLDAVEGRMGGVGWGKRLRRSATPGQTASVLRVLERLHPERAKAVLDEVSRPVTDRSGRRNTPLERQVGFAMFNHQLDAADLMAAVERVSPDAGRRLLETVSGHSHRWRVFTTELEHLQDPASLFAAVRHLARVGLLPGRTYSSWTEKVFSRWSKTAHLIAGPRRVADLLRVFLLWGRDDWSRAIAGEISVDRLAGRLGYGRRDDLVAVPRLINAFDLADHGDDAAEVVDAVGRLTPADVVAATGLDVSYDLVTAVDRHDPDLAWDLAEASVRDLPGELARTMVLDEQRRWTTIGWVGWLARARGVELALPRKQTLTVNLTVPHHAAWAMAHLPADVPWVRTGQRQSIDAVSARRPATPTELFFSLAAASAQDVPLDRVLPDEDQVAELLPQVSFTRIRALQAMSMRHAGLRDLLVAHREAVVRTTTVPEGRLSVHARDVRQWYARVPANTPQAG
ncbi:hypothetical protein [Micromonospora coxensis]|nr:hypothetical protein [Micromonospora coxensis]